MSARTSPRPNSFSLIETPSQAARLRGWKFRASRKGGKGTVGRNNPCPRQPNSQSLVSFFFLRLSCLSGANCQTNSLHLRLLEQLKKKNSYIYLQPGFSEDILAFINPSSTRFFFLFLVSLGLGCHACKLFFSRNICYC